MDDASANAFLEASLLDGEDECETPSMPFAELGPLRAQHCTFREMDAYQTAWSDLVGRAADANVFLDPAFALPLVQHLPAADRPDFLLIWDEGGPASFGRLVGLLPLARKRSILGSRALRGFKHNQAPLGLPLLDRDRADEAFLAMLDGLRATRLNAAALLLPSIPEDSVFHTLVTRHAGALDGASRRLGVHRRAIVRRQGRSTEVASLTSAKRRKELRRQKRRLAETGGLQYVSARTPAAIACATECFLALEQKGWKGRKGTALLADPALATFTRAMTRLMALDEKCRIDAIEIDGQPVAMGILLFAGDRAYFWKTTYDETYASLSPGVHLTLELTEALLADPDVAATDSCAMPDHPMIDKLWSERMTVVDLAINLRPDEPRRFERVVRLECAARELRAKAKMIYTRFASRRHSP